MNSSYLRVWWSLPGKEKTVTILVLLLVWGGVLSAITLSLQGIIKDPGSFFWGCIAGSFALSYLALIKKKLDIVSLLTPVYAIISFMGLEIQPNLLLQILFAASMTVLVIRLHLRFSSDAHR